MKKTIAAILVIASLLLCAVPAMATGADDTYHTSGTYVPQVMETANLSVIRVSGEYVTMVTSDALLEIIKLREGFVKYPTWDYGHWAIGYGCTCPDDMLEEYRSRGITEEEADALLREYVAEFEGYLNNFCKRKGYQLTQYQFDALIDFTYALGPSWMSQNCRLTSWLANPTTELDFANAIGRWCRVGGGISSGTCSRRIMEAKIFLYSDYEGCGTKDFCFLIYNGVDVNLTDSYKTDIQYYFKGRPYGEFLSPTRSGYYLEGWYTDASAGEKLQTSDIASRNATVYARWKQGSGSGYENDLPFIDVPVGSWFYEPVRFMYLTKLMNGTSANTFSPDAAMTRAMLVTVLYRQSGSPSVSGSSSFTDVPKGDWYSDAVAWAQQNGIVQGDGDNLFRPGDSITRQDTICIIHRYCTNYLGMSCPPYGDLSAFRDEATISGYARDAVAWAISAGVINGFEDGTFRPKESTTRAETAKILYCLLDKI